MACSSLIDFGFTKIQTIFDYPNSWTSADIKMTISKISNLFTTGIKIGLYFDT